MTKLGAHVNEQEADELLALLTRAVGEVDLASDQVTRAKLALYDARREYLNSGQCPGMLREVNTQYAGGHYNQYILPAVGMAIKALGGATQTVEVMHKMADKFAENRALRKILPEV